MRWRQELARFCAPGERKARSPALPERWATTIPTDVHVFAEDLTIKATGPHEIYPKLIPLGKYASIYQIHIRWDKIKIIIINGSDYALQSIRKILRGNIEELIL